MAIELNQGGYEHAKELIREGRAIADERGDWRDHRPDAKKEDAFISAMGVDHYGLWHLGMDDQQPVGSKARYHYLYGDFADLHRCSLFEIEDAADNFFYGDIEIAAVALISLMRSHPSTAQPAPEEAERS
jgi:hypothetical protein